MGAINDYSWAIDTNQDFPRWKEEALYRTCIFKDKCTLGQFFELKANLETASELGSDWQQRVIWLFSFVSVGTSYHCALLGCDCAETQ